MLDSALMSVVRLLYIHAANFSVLVCLESCKAVNRASLPHMQGPL